MGAQEVHDAILATLKPGEWVLAEVLWPNGVSAACYVGPEGLKYTSSGKVWPYDVTIVRLLDTRTDDADWVEVTVKEYREALYRRDEPPVREIFTRGAVTRGEWGYLYFIHRDDLPKPDPDADLIARVADLRSQTGVRSDVDASIIAAVREHDAKAGEQS